MTDATNGLDADVAAARDGDDDAFRAVYRRVHPHLLRYLHGLVGDDAEDIASETWLQVARGLTGFAGDGDAFRGWAATIARNRALDHVRHRRRRPSLPVPVESLTGHSDDFDTPAEALGDLASLHALTLVRSLPPDQAEAVLLRVVMGLDAVAAARVLGKRPGAVRTACYRGLRRLATLIDAPDPHGREAADPAAVAPLSPRTGVGVTARPGPTLKGVR
ncbi:MAG TPA: sigma-70 family RNA polymerase sigma factor [Micromonosporaceae bacterium]|nr:sigma-70 family RNA polymerase sigma factor [Micromonosporaceae bacterium]